MDARARKLEHRFFLAIASWFLLMTLAGFGPSVFFMTLDGEMVLPFVVHGIVFFLWVLLFFTQALLISSSNVALHRRLGVAGLVLLILMIPTGAWPVLHKAAAGTKSVTAAGFNLTTLCLAYTVAFLALAKRRTPDAHKRLMLLATMVFSVAAADRVTFALQFLLGQEDDARLFRKLLAIAPGVALLVFDAAVRKRVFVHAVLVLVIAWLILWYVASDLLFERPAGEQLIQWLSSAVPA